MNYDIGLSELLVGFVDLRLVAAGEKDDELEIRVRQDRLDMHQTQRLVDNSRRFLDQCRGLCPVSEPPIENPDHLAPNIFPDNKPSLFHVNLVLVSDFFAIGVHKSIGLGFGPEQSGFHESNSCRVSVQFTQK